MYDVTNEFEFHYDDDCSVDDIVGLSGIREDRTNYVQVRNDISSRLYSWSSSGANPGNPHVNNVRFTVTDSGEYAYEYFDLGMNFLPLASSTRQFQLEQQLSPTTTTAILTLTSQTTVSTVQETLTFQMISTSSSMVTITAVLTQTTEFT